MTRCPEFYAKWERFPNWCEKCLESVRLIENYLDLVQEFERRGLPREPTMVGLSERAARPLFTEKDLELKEKLIVSVKNWLETGKNPITGKFKKKITVKGVKAVKEQFVAFPPLPVGKFTVMHAGPPWTIGKTLS